VSSPAALLSKRAMRLAAQATVNWIFRFSFLSWGVFSIVIQYLDLFKISLAAACPPERGAQRKEIHEFHELNNDFTNFFLF
jgi:hypothetical protein